MANKPGLSPKIYGLIGTLGIAFGAAFGAFTDKKEPEKQPETPVSAPVSAAPAPVSPVAELPSNTASAAKNGMKLGGAALEITRILTGTPKPGGKKP